MVVPRRSRLFWLPLAALAFAMLAGVAVGQPGGGGTALASDWGVHNQTPQSAPLDAGTRDVWLCVFDPAGSDITVSHEFLGLTELMLFLHHPDAATCKDVSGGGTLKMTTGISARVLMLAQEPRVLSSPGVVRLEGAGLGVVTPPLGPSAEVGALSRSLGLHSQTVDANTLEVLGATDDAQERSVSGAAIAGRAVIVLIRDDVVGAPLLVRWEDPDWYARAPSWGHVGVVVAAGGFLVFYRGRPKQA